MQWNRSSYTSRKFRVIIPELLGMSAKFGNFFGASRDMDIEIESLSKSPLPTVFMEEEDYNCMESSLQASIVC